MRGKAPRAGEQETRRRHPLIGVATQFRMQFDREVVSGFLTYASAQTEWLVDMGLWASNELPRPDCDGYLLRGLDLAEAMPAAILGRSVVITGSEQRRYPQLWTDDLALGRMAATHLMGLGQRTLVFVYAAWIPAFARRYEAFLATAKAAGRPVVPVASSMTAPTTHGSNAQLKVLANVLRKSRPPVAVACCDPSAAYVALAACHDLGLSVPEDVALMACEDDEVLARACRPPLTAIDCRGRAVGYEAGDMLHRLLAGDTTVKPGSCAVVAPGGIVQRASTLQGRAREPAVRSALDVMQKRMAKPLSVTDIAEGASLSRRTLERLFRREIGRSPAAELMNMRLEKAAEVLLATPVSVTDIAARCGFSSAKHFVTAFRRRYGTPPNTYRLRRLALHRAATPRP